MDRNRLDAITARYPRLSVAVVGDFCLDRYLEIDPAPAETSIETGKTVHQVVKVRPQPGGAGTVVNNLVALGVGRIEVVSFCGEDGEGFELRRALAALSGVSLTHFVTTPERVTFTYRKPLVIHPNGPPIELERLDSKNRTPTPETISSRMIAGIQEIAPRVDALIVLEQVDQAETGVVTRSVLAALADVADRRRDMPILADSRRGLGDWPALSFKMNGAEFSSLLGLHGLATPGEVMPAASALAARQLRPIFVTLAEHGIVGADPRGRIEHVPALPLRGPIDIVGAGDAVTANLACALAGGASLREAVALAIIASSVVIHQVGTTGVATVADLVRFADAVEA